MSRPGSLSYHVPHSSTIKPTRFCGSYAVPSLSASASRDSAGRLHLSLVNLDPNHAAEITASISSGSIRNVSGEVLTATAMYAMNTFDHPNTVKPAAFSSFKLQGSQLNLSVPAKSVVVLELDTN